MKITVKELTYSLRKRAKFQSFSTIPFQLTYSQHKPKSCFVKDNERYQIFPFLENYSSLIKILKVIISIWYTYTHVATVDKSR